MEPKEPAKQQQPQPQNAGTLAAITTGPPSPVDAPPLSAPSGQNGAKRSNNGNGRGGARPGAGRKPGSKNRPAAVAPNDRITVVLTQQDCQKLINSLIREAERGAPWAIRLLFKCAFGK